MPDHAIPGWEEEDLAPRLDLASLIDMSFLMLVFFLVSATLQRQEADLSLQVPPPTSGAASEAGIQPERMMVRVGDAGALFVNGQVLDTRRADSETQALTDRLRRYAGASALAGFEPQVVISCADSAAEQRFIDVLNACRAAHIEQISLME